MQGFLPQIGSDFYSKVTSLHDFLKDFNNHIYTYI